MPGNACQSSESWQQIYLGIIWDWVAKVTEVVEAAAILPPRLTLEITEDFAISESGVMVVEQSES